MRKIKFRAWNGKQKKMFLVNNMNWFTSSACTPRQPSDLNLTDSKDYMVNYYEVESYENVCNKRGIYLMQFTGLKDKNSKEIYEGDIIKHDDEDQPYIQPNKPYVIEYCQGSFCFKEDYPVGLIFVGDELSIRRNILLDVELIGNIYENKELLEISKREDKNDKR